MSRSSSLAVLALSFTVVTPAAFGVVNAPTNVFGPGAAVSLGTNGADQWEAYLKYNSFNSFSLVHSAITATANPTEAQISNLVLGQSPAPYFGATGTTMLSPTIASTSYPTSGLLYLQDQIANSAGSGIDKNFHQQFDYRVGFVTTPNNYVAAMNVATDPNKVDPSENNTSGSMGVFFHFNGGNINASTTAAPDPNWTSGCQTSGGGNGLNFVAPTAINADTLGTTNPITTTMISGGAFTGTNVAYSNNMELSAQLVPDPAIPGNVLLQVKSGAQVNTASFNPSDARFGGGTFNWANATPIIFLGNGSWQSSKYATAHIGVFAPGDANADGTVDVSDFNALRSNFGGDNKTFTQGDFTQDGTVDVEDFNVLRSHFGTDVSAPVTGGTTLVSASNATAPGKIDLVVDPTTGDVKLVDSSTVTISSYQVKSASGALNVGNWLHVGNGLSVLGTPTSKLLSESTLGNGPTLDSSIFDLGDIYTGSLQDLTFKVFDNSGIAVTGVVSYVAVPEPATIAVIGLGLVGMMIRRRNA